MINSPSLSKLILSILANPLHAYIPSPKLRISSSDVQIRFYSLAGTAISKDSFSIRSTPFAPFTSLKGIHPRSARTLKNAAPCSRSNDPGQNAASDNPSHDSAKSERCLLVERTTFILHLYYNKLAPLFTFWLSSKNVDTYHLVLPTSNFFI